MLISFVMTLIKLDLLSHPVGLQACCWKLSPTQSLPLLQTLLRLTVRWSQVHTDHELHMDQSEKKIFNHFVLKKWPKV